MLGPLYFLIGKIGRDAPLAVTHPEFYYGFVGLGQLWQLVFIVIATDPAVRRPIRLVDRSILKPITSSR